MFRRARYFRFSDHSCRQIAFVCLLVFGLQDQASAQIADDIHVRCTPKAEWDCTLIQTPAGDIPATRSTDSEMIFQIDLGSDFDGIRTRYRANELKPSVSYRMDTEQVLYDDVSNFRTAPLIRQVINPGNILGLEVLIPIDLDVAIDLAPPELGLDRQSFRRLSVRALALQAGSAPGSNWRQNKTDKFLLRLVVERHAGRLVARYRPLELRPASVAITPGSDQSGSATGCQGPVNRIGYPHPTFVIDLTGIDQTASLDIQTSAFRYLLDAIAPRDLHMKGPTVDIDCIAAAYHAMPAKTAFKSTGAADVEPTLNNLTRHLDSLASQFDMIDLSMLRQENQRRIIRWHQRRLRRMANSGETGDLLRTRRHVDADRTALIRKQHHVATFVSALMADLARVDLMVAGTEDSLLAKEYAVSRASHTARQTHAVSQIDHVLSDPAREGHAVLVDQGVKAFQQLRDRILEQSDQGAGDTFRLLEARFHVDHRDGEDMARHLSAIVALTWSQSDRSKGQTVPLTSAACRRLQAIATDIGSLVTLSNAAALDGEPALPEPIPSVACSELIRQAHSVHVDAAGE